MLIAERIDIAPMMSLAIVALIFATAVIASYVFPTPERAR